MQNRYLEFYRNRLYFTFYSDCCFKEVFILLRIVRHLICMVPRACVCFVLLKILMVSTYLFALVTSPKPAPLTVIVSTTKSAIFDLRQPLATNTCSACWIMAAYIYVPILLNVTNTTKNIYVCSKLSVHFYIPL